MRGKVNNSAGTEEILKCPIPPLSPSKAGPFHHPTTQNDYGCMTCCACMITAIKPLSI